MIKLPVRFNKHSKILIYVAILLILIIIFELAIFSKAYTQLGTFLKKGSTHTVELQDDGFLPSEISVAKGETVIFTTTRKKQFWPASNLHPTHQIYPEFDPKRPVEADGSWSFKFDKAGRWRYHDHLAPNLTGTIIVTNSKNAQQKSVLAAASKCESVGISQKQKCWDDSLEETVKQQGLDAAFDLFTKLYQTDPSIPKACHGWSHILGKTAYELFKNKKDFILRKETSYCGYGFFHGFIEKLLQETGDLKATRDFCNYSSKQLEKEAPGVYRNCLHGIGHGSIDVDDPGLWSNFQAMLESGLNTCEATLTDKGELLECYDGSFNAMQQYAYHGEYNLSVDRNDPFNYCRTQQERHKDSCYYEFTGLIAEFTNHDFKKAANLILNDISDKNFTPRTIMKLSADFFQDDIANNDYTKNVLDCRALPANLQTSCFNGILLGFIAHGEPERQYIKGLEFCRYHILTDDERQNCYQWMLGQTVKKDSPACQSVEEKYRQYCQ